MKTIVIAFLCLSLSSCAYHERRMQEEQRKKESWARWRQEQAVEREKEEARRQIRLGAYLLGDDDYRNRVNERDAREEQTRRIEESNRAVVDAIKKNAAKSEETYCTPYGYGVNCTTTKFPPD